MMMEFDLTMDDLALFNGELLDYGSPSEITPYEGLKDEAVIYEAVPAPTDDKSFVYETLAHPQNGSQDLGLQDLLVESPRQDLVDPFPASPEWWDKKTDLVDILTGMDTSLQEVVHQVPLDSPPFPQQTQTLTLDAVSSLLLADLPAVEDTSVTLVVDDASMTLPFSTSNAHIDYLDALNQAGLEQLLGDAPDPSTAALFDSPILSPVSADDVDSLLSSSPPSPSEDATLASLFSSFSSKPLTSTLDDEQVGKVLCDGPQRASRDKARSAPYTVPSTTPTASPRKPKADRRERKKEQNRTAALRYREKKRSEQDILQDEADELTTKNDALRDKVDSISREIKYLKDLMAEVEKARSKAKKGGASSKQFHIAIPSLS